MRSSRKNDKRRNNNSKSEGLKSSEPFCILRHRDTNIWKRHLAVTIRTVMGGVGLSIKYRGPMSGLLPITNLASKHALTPRTMKKHGFWKQKPQILLGIWTPWGREATSQNKERSARSWPARSWEVARGLLGFNLPGPLKYAI